MYASLLLPSASCVLLCGHSHAALVSSQVHDIEDLAKAGRESGACPYFASRHFASALYACMPSRAVIIRVHATKLVMVAQAKLS